MNGNYYPGRGIDDRKYIFMFLIVEIRVYYYIYFISSVISLLVRNIFCFHKIFQETQQEHLCLHAGVVLFDFYITSI